MRGEPDPVPRALRRRGAEIIELPTRAPRADRVRRSRRGWLLFVAGAAGLVALGALTLSPQRPARQPEAIGGVDPPPLPAPAPPAGAPDRAPLAAPADALDGPRELAAPPLAPVLAAPPDAPLAVKANPLGSPALVFDAGAAPSGAALPAAASDPAAAEGATPRPDPRATLTRGTLIPAVLETAIDPRAPGFVRAVVPRDVLTADGGAVLVGRSSRLIGAYRNGPKDRQTRAYIVWTRLLRPDGGTVDLAAPPAMSRTLPGDADAAFVEAFDAAALRSTVASADARIRPGEPVGVLAARDLDLAPSAGN